MKRKNKNLDIKQKKYLLIQLALYYNGKLNTFDKLDTFKLLQLIKIYNKSK